MINQKKEKTVFLKRLKFTCLVLCGFCFMPNVIGQDDDKVKASVSGNLNCINSSVVLDCSFTGKQGTIIWKGPKGFRATRKNPRTSIPGKYTVSIKDPISGKTSSASVSVVLDTISPKGVLATASGLLTCKDSVVAIIGEPKTPGITYEWNGPNGYYSPTRNSEATVPGIYVLKATNPENGCFKQTRITVRQDILPPQDLSVVASGDLTCEKSQVRLTGTSGTPNLEYLWKGPGRFVSNQAGPIVTKGGKYELNVTRPENGCSTSGFLVVRQDTAKPKGVRVIKPDTLTCVNKFIRLSGASANKSNTVSWTGPEGFIHNGPQAQANIVGEYTFTATNVQNGCVSKKVVEVFKNERYPKDIALKASSSLSCKDSSVSILVASSEPRLDYQWSGPGNFKSRLVSPSIKIPGEYTVKATISDNGCSVTKSIVIPENREVPKGVGATVSGSIECNKGKVTLEGSCKTDKVDFEWTGPQGYKSSQKKSETSMEGNYRLRVTDRVNGCVSTTSIEVANNCSKK